jgi:hypothetical protein
LPDYGLADRCPAVDLFHCGCAPSKDPQEITCVFTGPFRKPEEMLGHGGHALNGWSNRPGGTLSKVKGLAEGYFGRKEAVRLGSFLKKQKAAAQVALVS